MGPLTGLGAGVYEGNLWHWDLEQSQRLYCRLSVSLPLLSSELSLYLARRPPHDVVSSTYLLDLGHRDLVFGRHNAQWSIETRFEHLECDRDLVLEYLGEDGMY